MKNLLTITILLFSLNIFASNATSNTQPQETFRVRLIEGMKNYINVNKVQESSNIKNH